MGKPILTIAILISLLALAKNKATSQKIQWGVQLGINAGAPLPKKISAGAKGKPGIQPLLGVVAQTTLTKHHSLQIGLRYEQKSASYFSPVQYDYIVISGDSIDHFSGNVDGQFKNHYLSLPLNYFYALNKKWKLGAGVHAARLLKGKNQGTIKNGVAGFAGAFKIDDQPYNETQNIKKLDAGTQFTLAYAITTHLSLQWQTTYGITSLTKPTDNFKDPTHNLYTYLTANYFF